MSLLLTGPVDKPAMNIQATINPICLTLSPAIVRLIIHAVQTLMPQQVRDDIFNFVYMYTNTDNFHTCIICFSGQAYLSAVCTGNNVFSIRWQLTLLHPLISGRKSQLVIPTSGFSYQV